MEKKCSECGMVNNHKMPCSQRYKSREDLKEMLSRQKEDFLYQHLDRNAV